MKDSKQRGLQMTPKQRAHIDGMNYESMLSLWRNAPVGHPMFQGETGRYYAKIMKIKRQSVGNAAHVAASKNIGWDG